MLPLFRSFGWMLLPITLTGLVILWQPWAPSLPMSSAPKRSDAVEVAAPNGPAARPFEPNSAQSSSTAPAPFATTPVTLDGSRITGRVFDYGGQPAADVRVEVLVDEGELELSGKAIASTVVNADGSFEVRFETEATWVALRVADPDRGRASRRTVAVPRNAELAIGDLTLIPEFAIEGTVLDPHGMPVADVVVGASVAMGADLLAWKTTTDIHGRFALPCTGVGGEAHLYAAHPSWGLGFVENAGCGKDPVTMVLTEPHRIRGIVRDSEGEPIEGAEVALDVALYRITHTGGQFPDDPPRHVLTRADGSFEIGPVHPGDVYLRFRAPEFLIEERHVLVESGQTPEIEITLAPQPIGQVFAGVVVDQESRQPVAGAQIGDVVTDVDGRFEWHKRPTSHFDHSFGSSLTAIAPGYARLTLEVPRSGDVTDLRFDLRRSARVRGLVLYPDGSPVLDAHVSFDGDLERAKKRGLPKPRSNVLTTDRDGRFSGEIDPGPYSQIWVYHPGSAHRVRVEDPDPQPGAELEWRVVIGEGLSVAGRLIDAESGKGVPEGRIRGWVETDDGWKRICEATSGWEGSFLLRGISHERIWLSIETPGFAPKILERVPTALESKVRLIRLEEGLTLTGRLEGPDGEPVSGGSVRLEGTTPREAALLSGISQWGIGEDGEFRFENLPAIPLELTAYVPRDRRDELEPATEILQPPFGDRKIIMTGK